MKDRNKFVKGKKTALFRKASLLLICCLLFSLTLGGCRSTEANTKLPKLAAPLTKSDFLLNTFVSITLYDRGNETLIQECFDICRNYEALLSRTVQTSEISRINSATEYPVQISADTADLLQRALYYSELSDGAFDLTIAPLTSLWDFSALEPKKPEDTAIQAAISHIDYKGFTLTQSEGGQFSASLSDPEAAIDLGAIAKGYIADRIKDHLVSAGVESAIINLGGNVLCIGGKYSSESGNSESGFKIGIQKPFEDRNETIAVMELKDMSVVSSGIYERCFREDVVFYHHILNPDTGYPYDNNLTSVTIISKLSVDGDGLSTTCFALGLEKGMELIDSLPDVYAVFITADDELHYSAGFMEHITIVP